jgi:hypothetical protein
LASPVRSHFHQDPELGARFPVTQPEDFITAWNQSALKETMDLQYLLPLQASATGLAGKKPQSGPISGLSLEYAISRPRQLAYLLWRSRLLFPRELRKTLMSVAINAFFGIVVGFYFFQLPRTQLGARSRQSLIFFSAVKLAFVSIGTIPVLFRDRVVFYKQRDNKYYAPFPFALSQFLSGIPQAIVEVLVYSSLVYWIAGLQRVAGRFFYFFVMLLLTNQVPVPS